MSGDQQILSIIANIEMKENDVKQPKFYIQYGRISITLGSVIAGCNCIGNVGIKNQVYDALKICATSFSGFKRIINVNL